MGTSLDAEYWDKLRDLQGQKFAAGCAAGAGPGWLGPMAWFGLGPTGGFCAGRSPAVTTQSRTARVALGASPPLNSS